jgi:hypothetical protein
MTPAQKAYAAASEELKDIEEIAVANDPANRVTDPEAEMVERVAEAMENAFVKHGCISWPVLARAVVALCRPVYRRQGME